MSQSPFSGISAIRVLMIEDDEQFAALIKEFLSKEKNFTFQIDWQNRVSLGLDRLTQKVTDVVLLDLHLPDSGGIETVGRIHEKTPEVPIIVLTNMDDENLAMQAMKSGAQDYLIKGAVDGKLLSRVMRYAIERKKVQQALRESEARYREIAANIPGAVYQFLLKKDGSVSFPFMSGGVERLTGLTAEEVERDASTTFAMIRPAELETFHQSIAESARTMQTWVREYSIVTKNGEVKWLRATSEPHLREDGSVLWNGVILDISDRKIAEMELKNAYAELKEKEKRLIQALDELRRVHSELRSTQNQLFEAEKFDSVGRLAAGVAHEVKNPLAILLQGIDCLRQAPPVDHDAAKQVLADMEEAINRADSVVHGLLDFARLSEAVMESDNLNTVIDGALTLTKHEFDRHHVQVVRKLARTLSDIRLDKNRMQQVFVNLFLNAAQAMPQGGELTVQTVMITFPDFIGRFGSKYNRFYSEGDTIMVAIVEDTGSGVPESMLDRIFEPFFTTKRGQGGTGLGLSVVKNIVEMHNGRVEIRNNETVGAKVILTFKA